MDVFGYWKYACCTGSGLNRASRNSCVIQQKLITALPGRPSFDAEGPRDWMIKRDRDSVAARPKRFARDQNDSTEMLENVSPESLFGGNGIGVGIGIEGAGVERRWGRPVQH